MVCTAFTPSTPVLARRGIVARKQVCSHQGTVCMAAKGFGKDPAPAPRTPSEASQKRDAAAERLEKMREQNAPEYSIWLRINSIEKQAPDEADFPWLPVGSITIPRGAEVSKAIFNEDVFEDLMSGARRLFPNLKDYEQESIDVGYKLKGGEDDEDIQLAVRPKENFFTSLLGRFRKQ